MTIAELDTAVRAICPIQGIDGQTGVIWFDPLATQQQKDSANAIVSANLAKVNGNPARVPLDTLTIFNAIKNGGTLGLTPAQQLSVCLACAAVTMSQNPGLAARINTALNVAIPYDQANPQG